MINCLKVLLLMFIIAVNCNATQAAKIDDEQDQKIKELRSQLEQHSDKYEYLEQRIADLQSKNRRANNKQFTRKEEKLIRNLLVSKERKSWSKSDNSKLQNITKRLNTLNDKITQIENAISNGLDKNIVADKLSNYYSERKSLESVRQKLVQRKPASEEKDKENKLEFSGAFEIEVGYGEDFAGGYTNNISLTKVQLNFAYQANEWINGEAELLYEDDGGTPLDVDVAGITIANTEKLPLYLFAGKKVLSFGVYESFMITDPIGLSLFETKLSNLEFGIDWEGLHSSLFIYNGPAEKSGDKDVIRSYGVNLAYEYTWKQLTLSGGIGYISNSADLSGIIGTTSTLSKRVPAMSYYFKANYQDIHFIFEHIQTNKFDVTDIALNSKATEVSSCQFELGYEFLDNTIALGWQLSKGAVATTNTQPEKRFLISFAREIFKNTTLAGEYYKSEDYSIADGGTGNKDQQFTIQLAIEF